MADGCSMKTESMMSKAISPMKMRASRLKAMMMKKKGTSKK